MLANEAALRMMRWFLGLPAHAPIAHHGSLNVLALMLDPGGLRPCLANWEAVGTDLPGGQREATGDGPASESGQLLATMPDAQGERAALPFLPVTLRKDRLELNLFTSITTLATLHDVTLHELRLESFFPADEASREWFEAPARQRA